MTNELEKKAGIKRGGLDPGRYFVSLLEKSLGMGLLADPGGVPAQSALLFSEIAKKYSFGASGSLSGETARELMESAFYCIGHKLKTVEPDEAVRLINERPLKALFEEGKELVKADAARAKALHAGIKENALETQNMAYNDTLFEGMEVFFLGYDPDYSAHGSPGSIDYPLCIPFAGLSGVEYMTEYLRRLSMEERLCARFRGETEALLRGYGAGYRELYVNIYEAVMTNALGRALCGRDTGSLDLSGEDLAKLEKCLSSANGKRLRAMLAAVAERVCSESGISGETDRAYARAASGDIAARLKAALETGTLYKLFLRLSPGGARHIRFEDGSGMSDEMLRGIIEEISECRYASDRIAMMKRHFSSLEDLCAALGSGCLCGGDYDALFSALDPGILALLSDRMEDEDELHISEGEREWHSSLRGFLELKRNNKADPGTEQ